jgi:prepilin-type N-terminal cleavage/methylation domain-containing protein
VTIRPPKYNAQGFTLIEMIVTVMVAGIIMTIATPSLLSLNKPLREGSLQFKSQLSLIRSKAISSSKAYRIRPKFTALTDYPDGIARNFVVEYAANCRVTATGGTDGWQMASQFDLELPQNVGIIKDDTTLPAPTGTVTNSLNWTTDAKRICFDNRGLLDGIARKVIVLRDFQAFNRARLAEIEVTVVGGIEVKTYDDSRVEIPRISMDIDSVTSSPIPGTGNPAF